jgi:hypothetical protein
MARKKSEQVRHPKHYGGEDNPYEVIKVLEAWGLDKDFLLGNTVKYIARNGKKEGNSVLQELEKSAWYLLRKIANLKKEMETKTNARNKRNVARKRNGKKDRRPGPRVRKTRGSHGKRSVGRPSRKGVVRRRVASGR